LKLKYDASLSNVAFNCNLRHYMEGALACAMPGGAVQVDPGSTPLGFSTLLGFNA